MPLSPEFLVVRQRARPMSPEERRAHIIDAVIPLLKQYGRDVSTRQIAEASGVAEGTIFRAFGDKESLIGAAIQRYFDPQPFRDALRGIDPDEPTIDKLRQVLQVLRDRFTGIVGLMSALRMEGGPPPGVLPPPGSEEWLDILGRIFRDDELAVPPQNLGYFLRLVAFGSALPPVNRPHEFTTEELVSLISHGVVAPERKA